MMDELLELMEQAEKTYEAIMRGTHECMMGMMRLWCDVNRVGDLPVEDREAAIDAVARLFDCAPRV